MHKILVIDDDKISHKVIERALESKFEVIHAFSGEEGLIAATKNQPQVILLDVEMPGMNGYEVCDAISHNPDLLEIPVIFVSSRSSLRERMQGYEVGGADYVVKPFTNEDLLAKLQVLTLYREKQATLKQEMEQAKKTAYIAMSGSSELGQAMGFVERCASTVDYTNLARQFLQVMDMYSLKCVILIAVDNDTHWFSNSGSVSPLENQLVSMLRNQKRFYDFGCRTQVNYPNICLLVKNMPIDDMERYGRIKDFLPAMLSAANSRIATLAAEQAIRQQVEDVSVAFLSIQQVFGELTTSLQENQGKSVQLLRGMLNELTRDFPGLGLEQDQEEAILNKIEKAVIRASKLVDSSENIKEAFDMIILKISALSDKQKELLSKLAQTHVVNGGDLDDVAAVELF